jgi:competence protein ComEC
VARRAADTVLKVVSERSLFAAPSEGTVPARIAEPVSPARVPSIASPPILDVPPAPVSSPKGMVARFSAGGLSALQLALSTEADRGTLFLFVPILLAAGSLAYFTAPGEPAFYALWASAVTLAVLAVLSRTRRLLQLAFIVALIVVLGVSFAKLETWRAGTKVLGGEISTRLTGRVELVEHQANGRTRLTIDVIATERPQLRYAPERKIPVDIVAGSEITGIVRLRPPTGPVRPDSYDFSFESYFDGIGANGFFLSGPDLVETPAAPGPMARFSASVENVRTALAARIRNRIGGVEG